MTEKIKDPGMGRFSSEKPKRFINSDGSFNIRHINKPKSFSERYEYLIRISWTAFFVWVLLGYVVVNVFFATLYVALGVSSIVEPTGDWLLDFFNAFFFSAQTITTVGYGAMAPKGLIFGVLSSFEALVGLLSFSFITGLLYGRFSKPKPNIRFSDCLVLCKYSGKDSVMFKLMSRSSNVMIRPVIQVTLSLSEKGQNGEYENNFYKLMLERDSITYLPTTWTVVHPINEMSPLKDYDRQELTSLKGEVLILLSYYDESFSQEVHQTHSYLLSDLWLDKKFVTAFNVDEDGNTVLDHSKLNQTKGV